MSVTLHTDLGDLKFELEVQKTPKTCENFLALAASGYYDGCIFHRVIKTFCCQTGDPTNVGNGGQSCWGKNFNDEIDSSLKHSRRGVLAMATARPNMNASQFYIAFNRLPHLDGRATVFGQLIDGIFDILKCNKFKIKILMNN